MSNRRLMSTRRVDFYIQRTFDEKENKDKLYRNQKSGEAYDQLRRMGENERKGFQSLS